MQRCHLNLLSLCFLLIATACQTSLVQDVETRLTNPEQTGIRWGVVVADLDGTEQLAIRPDERFTPASNTKIVTTMASYHFLDDLSSDANNPGTRAFLVEETEGELPTLILRGGGDAMLTDAPDCESSCLSDLADAVAATGITQFGTLIGDDTFFPFERWGPGWSIEDLQYYYGTAVSALSVNDNLVWLDLRPGEAIGAPAQVAWRAGDARFDLSNEILTTHSSIERSLRTKREPDSKRVRIYGTLPVNSDPISFALAVDDPAALATARFVDLLRDRNISVDRTDVRHRPLTLLDEENFSIVLGDEVEAELNGETLPAHPYKIWRDAHQRPKVGSLIATLSGSDLRDSLRRISKDSENLHAEIALRRLGRLSGTGSRDFGLAAVDAFLAEAGISENSMTFHGGSGMSVYNRITPRSMVRLITYAAAQPWFEDWLADQPIGGVDGSLAARFKGTSLDGKIFAKTGTLNGANALSGVMVARSGRRLAFSIIANDRPPNTRSAIPEMDAALVLIAETY